jgi:hypothetical protein
VGVQCLANQRADGSIPALTTAEGAPSPLWTVGCAGPSKLTAAHNWMMRAPSIRRGGLRLSDVLWLGDLGLAAGRVAAWYGLGVVHAALANQSFFTAY